MVHMFSFDHGLFLTINELTANNAVLSALAIFLAQWLIFGLVAIVAAVGLYAVATKHNLARKNEVARDLALFYRAAIAASGAVLDSLIISLLVFRNRPFVTSSGAILLIDPPLTIKSFPSDHATIAFALAVTVLMLNRRLGYLMLLCACGVALGRIMVGVHYPLDVLGGAVLGSVWAWVVAMIARHWKDIDWVKGQLDLIHQTKVKV